LNAVPERIGAGASAAFVLATGPGATPAEAYVKKNLGGLEQAVARL
jgi:hypothetical protein